MCDNGTKTIKPCDHKITTVFSKQEVFSAHCNQIDDTGALELGSVWFYDKSKICIAILLDKMGKTHCSAFKFKLYLCKEN